MHPKTDGMIVVCNDGDYFLRHRRAVADRLAEGGVNVHVIAGGQPIPAERRAGWTFAFLPIERFAFHPLRDLRLTFAVARAIAARRPQAVHLITLKPIVFGGLAAVAMRLLSGAPRRIVMTVAGLGRLMSPAAGGKGFGRRAARSLLGLAVRFLSWRGCVFTFESTQDRQTWLDLGLIGTENSVVIKGAGVDPAVFFPASGCEPRSPAMTVLFASRLLRSKGLDAFVQTARRFSGRGDVRFLVAGMIEPHDPDGYAPEELRRESAVEFLGEIHGLGPLLRQADLVCLPTRYGEGIPRILIEAAATGVACLASDTPGCREIVRHGVNGTLVPVEDPKLTVEAMTDAIETYLRHPGTLRAQGRESLKIFREGGFEEKAVVDRFVALLLG